jgi:hypothetical protein
LEAGKSIERRRDLETPLHEVVGTASGYRDVAEEDDYDRPSIELSRSKEAALHSSVLKPALGGTRWEYVLV